ncbi:MAG: fluoride efflux transporter CrcB [Alphaproteobacteria bacterium]|nr:fluoride efflux transporter CrcB [Alphaproteobacteria bacterium]MDE2042235.1 fluoride efflux transporter CrcB [Alphaproteobacteria bacterium]MDE2340440.1 fluoride efflux transporter CrcB [Alphaproteobacteria bacterium]
MQALIIVMLGGGLGAGMRHLTGLAMLRLIGPGFPYGTLTANLVGGFLMGILAGWLARYGHGGETWRLFLGVGVLGGYTTFSSFSLEVMLMFERGTFGTALGYVALSVIGAVGALALGLATMRAIG